MKKLIITLGLLFSCVMCMNACGNTNDNVNMETTPTTEQTETQNLSYLLNNAENPDKPFSVSLKSNNGGYHIKHKDVELLVEVVDQEKHIFLKNPKRTMEMFVNDAQIVLFVEEDGKTSYYYNPISDDLKMEYVNPMSSRLVQINGLETLQFNKQNDTTYVAKTMVKVPVQNQINYTSYTVDMTWNTTPYHFEYFVYEDGATLMTADAPVEMHPILTKDTAWTVNLKDSQMYNTETNETVPFTIAKTETGKSISPNSVSETKEVPYNMTIETDEKNNIQKIVTEQDNSVVTIDAVYTDELIIPHETEEMEQLDLALAKDLIQVMFMVESMF